MSSTIPPKRKLRTTRTPKKPPKPAAPKAVQSKTKLDALVAALSSAKGATIPDLMALTGWQSHSVRGALAGAIKKRGYTISSTKTKAGRVYRAEAAR